MDDERPRTPADEDGGSAAEGGRWQVGRRERVAVCRLSTWKIMGWWLQACTMCATAKQKRNGQKRQIEQSEIEPSEIAK